jgi:hypothetical protein
VAGPQLYGFRLAGCGVVIDVQPEVTISTVKLLTGGF